MIDKNFINHPLIQTLGNKPRWTISTADKMPVDMQKLIQKDHIGGARFTNPDSLTKLEHVTDFFNKQNLMLTNCCFYLYTMLDDVIVLDVEKTCPDDIKEKFLQTPYLYGEYSMSGQGYHLIYPVPDWLKNYPIAEKKSVIRHPDGIFEILMIHYCTFTGNIIPPCSNPTDFFDKTFKELASIQKETASTDITMIEPDKPDMARTDQLLDILTVAGRNFPKKPTDYLNAKGMPDASGYEFALTGYLYRQYKKLIKTATIQNENYTFTDNDAAWFVYNALKANVPPRAKHNTRRNDMPYLLYSVWRLIDMDSERT